MDRTEAKTGVARLSIARRQDLEAPAAFVEAALRRKEVESAA
jgi:hypothetical protein